MQHNHSVPRRCESCQTDENGPCIKHCSTFIPDQNPLPRAYASLPWQLLIRDFEGQYNASTKLKRVFTRTSISTGTVFGPLVGPLVDPEIYQRAYQFGFIQDGKLLVYNLTGDNRSNWMKFVRLSEDPNKVNLMAYQHGLQVYFITLRTLLADEELCVGYSYHYAESIGKIQSNSEVRLDDPGIVKFFPPMEVEPYVEVNLLDSLLPAEENIELQVNGCIANYAGLPLPGMLNEGSPPKKRKARAPSTKKKRDKQSKCEEFTSKLLSEPSECVDGYHHDDDSDADYEEVEEPIIAPPKKSKSHKKEIKVELGGVELEVPEKEKRMKKDRPLTEVAQLMISEKKLTPASISLAKHTRYGCVCKTEGCGTEYKIPSLLAIHETKHGADIPEGFTTSGPQKCPACETEVPSFQDLVSHIVEHQGYYRNHRERLPCDKCPKTLASEKMLARHKARLHTGEAVKPFECDKCDGKFVTLAGMKSHVNFHHGLRKGFECPVCLECFSGSAALNLHSETHRVNGKFPCRICNKVYENWITMRRHMKVQHKFRNKICTVCQKAFLKTADLTRHEVVHFDVFKFSCDTCGRKFKRETKLVEHQQRLHNPDRQYKMKGRSEKVAQSFANAQVCTFCHRQYNSVERLLEHQRINHGQGLLEV